MAYLLDNKFAPLTFCWGFVRAPLPAVAAAFLAWRAQLAIATDVETFNAELAEGLGRLPPLTIPPSRYLMIETESDWTACFDNSASIGDLSPTISFLSQAIACEGLAICCKPQTWQLGMPAGLGVNEAVRFTLFSPRPTEWLNVRRYISMTRENENWKFTSEGKLLPFERPDVYKARHARDRFTPALLAEYCIALGIRVADADYYGGEARILVDTSMAERVQNVLSLEDARAKTGL